MRIIICNCSDFLQSFFLLFFPTLYILRLLAAKSHISRTRFRAGQIDSFKNRKKRIVSWMSSKGSGFLFQQFNTSNIPAAYKDIQNQKFKIYIFLKMLESLVFYSLSHVLIVFIFPFENRVVQPQNPGWNIPSVCIQQCCGSESGFRSGLFGLPGSGSGYFIHKKTLVILIYSLYKVV